MDATTRLPDERGVGTVSRHLDERHVRYVVVDHAETFSAADEARAAHFPLAETAKTVLLRDRDGYAAAVVPASRRVDVQKVRNVLNREHLRLASEEEMAADFFEFQLGALPPLSGLLGAQEVVDRQLVERRRILCSAGDHRHALLLDPLDVVGEGYSRIADICR